MILKKTLLTLVVFGFFVLSASAQVSSKFATARIIEAPAIRTSAILVVYETGENETIPLNKLESFVKEEKAYTAMIENQKIINQFLGKMAAKGYEIKNMTTTGDSFQYTFLIFEKKP